MAHIKEIAVMPAVGPWLTTFEGNETIGGRMRTRPSGRASAEQDRKELQCDLAL
jgi:hypothetical protein